MVILKLMLIMDYHVRDETNDEIDLDVASWNYYN